MNKLNCLVKRNILFLALGIIGLTIVGCGSQEGEAVESTLTMTMPMEELMGSYEATLLAGQSADTMAMTEEFLVEAYGITPDMYEELQGRIPSDEQWCDEYIFVKTSPGGSDAIVDAVKSRVVVLTSKDSGLSEEHLEQVEAYELYVRDDYVAFSFGLCAELAIDYFKAAIVEE